MANVYLGLGSNQGDSLANLRCGLERLAKLPRTQLVSTAKFVFSKAIGPKQPDYCNTVALIHTHLSPLTLLYHCQNIELLFGGKQQHRWGPRILDIDILFYDELVINYPMLTLPHPGIASRPFVSEPLVELLSG